MKKPVHVVTAEPAGPNEYVYFTVVVRPHSGLDLNGLRDKLHVRTFQETKTDDKTLRAIADKLESNGFEVYRDEMSLDVSARGTVAQFENVFQTKLEKRIRHVTEESNSGKRTYTQQWFALKDGAPAPSLDSIPNALAIALPAAPLLLTPRIPPVFPGFNLRVPGDIAQLLSASFTHRKKVASGDRATGGGITVAVIDSGFAPHPYYDDHGYDITRVAASDALDPDPTVDSEGHGTGILANLLACAPDVSVIAVKYGPLPQLAFAKALSFHPNVISYSVGYPVGNVPPLPGDYVPLSNAIVQAVAGNTVVVVAGGNYGEQVFPAMMPETLAVGGVDIDGADHLQVAVSSSSFVNPIYPSRKVPDVSAFATEIVLPAPGPGGAPDWATIGYTSCATPQVAGVCALLFQNNPLLAPPLTPQLIRSILIETADPVNGGGRLVNAFRAWKGVGQLA